MGTPETPEAWQLPASARLYQVIKQLSQILGAEAIATAAAEDTEQHDYAPVEVNNFSAIHGADKTPLEIGPVDAVQVTEISMSTDGMVSLGLNLYSDGSPFVFNQDLELVNGSPQDYNLVLFGENPPTLILAEKLHVLESERSDGFHEATLNYLEGVRRGEIPPVYQLNEQESEALINALGNMDLAGKAEID